MKNITKLIAGLVLVVGYSTSASALTITPADADCTAAAYGPANGGPDEDFLTYCGVTATQVYKNDVPSTESGSLADDYTSVLNGDNSGGTITWDGPDFLLCTGGNTCYLLVKDGAESPYRYLFDITGWDGKETITLSGFWPGNGSISHWALYGGIGTGDDDDDDDTDLPEPGTLGLLGLGLLGVGLSRRRRV